MNKVSTKKVAAKKSSKNTARKVAGKSVSKRGVASEAPAAAKKSTKKTTAKAAEAPAKVKAPTKRELAIKAIEANAQHIGSDNGKIFAAIVKTAGLDGDKALENAKGHFYYIIRNGLAKVPAKAKVAA